MPWRQKIPAEHDDILKGRSNVIYMDVSDVEIQVGLTEAMKMTIQDLAVDSAM
ncbi:hypothetical protein E8E11_004932 [Didymella keratinophila]|nr:hypothetical protein E8E11_004932 [Didymella keratinophila]